MSGSSARTCGGCGADEVKRDATWSQAFGLTGPHNERNASMARAVLEGLGIPGATDEDRLAAAAQGFDGLPSRCRSLGSVGAVEFVDDSLSTNVLPAQAALRAFADRPVALLVGGHDRGVDYAPLGRTIAARTAPTLVVTMPDNGPRIGQAIRAHTEGRVEIRVLRTSTLQSRRHFAWAPTRGVILLSPAAPSFGRFGTTGSVLLPFAAAASRCGNFS